MKKKSWTTRLGNNERVDNYNGGIQDNSQRMVNHEIPYDFMVSIFINDLCCMESNNYVN